MNLYIGIAHVVDTLARVGNAFLDALFPIAPDETLAVAEAAGVLAQQHPLPPRLDPVFVVDGHLAGIPSADAPCWRPLVDEIPIGYVPIEDLRTAGEQWAQSSLEQGLDILRWGGEGQ